DRAQGTPDVRRREGGVYAMRNLLRVLQEVRQYSASAPVRWLVEEILGPFAFPVRGLSFDKPAGHNWKVPWHQDLSISVRERREVPGFGPWSLKAGVPHVQPPIGILERMLAVRLHLDACGETDGPLQVLPGSHAHGRLDRTGIRQWRE